LIEQERFLGIVFIQGCHEVVEALPDVGIGELEVGEFLS